MKENYNRATSSRGKFNSKNKVANKKPHGKAPKFNKAPQLFKNVIRFKRMDPRTYAKEAMRAYAGEPTREENINFRSALFDCYHLYAIIASTENHFTNGYSYKQVGWMAARKEVPCKTGNTLNITIWNSDENISDDLWQNVYYAAANMANDMFKQMGHQVRFIAGTKYYKNHLKDFGSNWIIDGRSNTFTDIFDNSVTLYQKGKAGSAKILPTDLTENRVILISRGVGSFISYGKDIGNDVSEYIMLEYNVKMEVIPYKGIKLIDDRTNELLATVKKCNNKSEVFVSDANPTNYSLIEDIIKYGVEFENKDHKHPYNKIERVKVIFEGSINV